MTDLQDRDEAERPVARVDSALEALIPRFLDRRRDDTDAIEALVDSGDFETIKSMAHSIKGSGGGYGFDPITDYGVEIEAAAREGDGPATILASRKLRAYIDSVQIVFVDE
jgi:HPt (histidine-containing phosphotransfer) domain-containing protein